MLILTIEHAKVTYTNECQLITTKGGVENKRLSRSRPKAQKNFEAKDCPSEDRPSLGQEQEYSRPRTKDTGASVLRRKKRSLKDFSGNL